MNSLQKVLHIFKSPALSQVFRWGRCIRLRQVIICLAVVLNTLASLGTTLVTRGLIDSAVSSQADGLWRWGILLAVLIAAERLLRVLSSGLRLTASARLQRDLQGQLMTGLLSREYPGLKRYHSGELVNRVFSDVGVVKGGIMNMPSNLCSMLVSFVGAVIIVGSMSWQLVIALLAGSVLGAGILLLFRNPMKDRHKRMQEADSHLHASVQETLENVRLVKASLSEEQILRRVHQNQQELEQEQVRQGRFSLVMNHSLGTMFDISWLVCMLWGCVCIFRGQLTYGSLAALIQLIGRIQGPIAGAADLAAQAYGVIASAERLQELLALPEEKQAAPVRDFDKITLENVSFAYEDGNEEVLHGISCEIRKGDAVALTGISGGGKTSLFQLLLGIYAPVSGRIVFHTPEGDTEANRGTRALFAYVPQGNTLISGTLRENLTLFAGEATDEQLKAACRAACIEPLVEELGLGAMLGERGVGLSEGQAQRVAVARAILSGAPILLLDESTSALDEATEAELLRNLSGMEGKTCLIVTHRRAALEICNRELHIDGGRMKGNP